MKTFHFHIDTLGVGQCNLNCPSCPVGNSEIKNPTGLMESQLLYEILSKAVIECNLRSVGLYSWTEPLLHPQLPELIEIINSFSIISGISSNLNFKRDLYPVIEANPSFFCISASGFNQSIYSQFHRGGNIEIVKENMKKLSEITQKLNAKTHIYVAYHRYLENLDDEMLMRDYATSLGFAFNPSWAYFMNLDKQINFLDGDHSVLSQQDLKIIQKMTVPFWEATNLLQNHKNLPCVLRESQMALDHLGNVLLCCAAYDTSKHRIGNFLDLSIDQIQLRKHESKTCNKCMKNSLHNYFIYGTQGNKEINNKSLENITINNFSRLGYTLNGDPLETS